jgi:hypothetical protein
MYYSLVKDVFKKKLEDKLQGFFTYHVRPKKSENVNLKPIYDVKRVVAIVMQGPVLEEDSFTVETLMLYKKMFKGFVIILSTWNDLGNENIKLLEEIGVEVLINEYPDYSGPSNINYQIISMRNGIRYAESKGAEYVLKTRTDQRIYNPDIFSYMISMQNNFVSKVKKQNNRIIFCSLNSFKFRLYSLSDMFVFGEIKDMARFCDVEPVKPGSKKNNVNNILDWSKARTAEVYLITEYFKRIGYSFDWCLESYWNSLSDLFCVIDEKIVDIYWYKYLRHSEYRYTIYDVIKNSQNLYFNDWLLFYTGDYECTVDEKCLQSTSFDKSAEDCY